MPVRMINAFPRQSKKTVINVLLCVSNFHVYKFKHFEDVMKVFLYLRLQVFLLREIIKM